MGLMDDLGLDFNEIKANTGFDVDAGFYNFEIGAAFIKEGSPAHPDDSWLIVEYLLEDEDGRDAGKTSDMWTLPKDPDNLTKQELQKMGFYKARMLELGFKESEINDIDESDLIGLTGTLEVFKQNGKGANAKTIYTNIRNVRVSADEVETTFDEPEPEPEKPKRPARKAAAEADAPSDDEFARRPRRR